ncbi:glycosyltransferase [Enterovirga sp.]|uniref:glycosyltransferase family 2 protein n=1 Tax=Enterovirga sp. TaxID=2026350 RepID=UPI002B74DF74|nr:glycosyltransferase [Enterovirga sp.]HMO30738.1 glycosyltransferase [Enterovirga sp.]
MSLELSIVMAAYNEEVSIVGAVEDAVASVAPLVADFEIIVVNDGSRDRTGELLADLARREPRLRIIDQKNAGHGPALIAGLSAAQGVTLLILDSDRQISLEDFAEHWRMYGRHDAVIGIRADRHDGWFRGVTSLMMRCLALALFRGSVPKDPNIPFKILPRQAWVMAAGAIGPDNPIPSALLAIHMRLSGLDIGQRAVVHRPRRGSMSSFRGVRLMQFCLIAFRSMVRFRLCRPIQDLMATRERQVLPR